MKFLHKNGFTLMELLVYMAIIGVVVLIAGQAFKDSTKMRIRTQNMLKASEIAESTGALFKDDVAQMGAKSAVSGMNTYAFKAGAMMHPSDAAESKRDSSSFFVNSTKDSLAMRRIRYNEDGSYRSIEGVSWYVKDGTLYRSCVTLDGADDGDRCPKTAASVVEYSTDVETFKVVPAKPTSFTATSVMFPYYAADLSNKKFRFISYYGEGNYGRVVTNPAEGATSVDLMGFSTNYDGTTTLPTDPIKHLVFVAPAGATADGWKQNCQQFVFKKDSLYEVSFAMGNNGDETRMFRPGVDHMAVGVRTLDEDVPARVAGMDDFLFYPPSATNGTTIRTVRFSPPAEVTACVAFTFVFYSPTVSLGKLIINDLQVRQVSETYEFDDAFNPETKVTDKKDIRAFQLEFVVKKGSQNKPERGAVKMVVPVPSNGVEN